MVKSLSSSKAPQAIGPYSQAIQSGNFIFLSGQIPLNPETNQMVENDITEQTKQIMLNIKGLLEDLHLSFKNIVKTTIFLNDLSKFEDVNHVYSSFLDGHKPARSTVEVSKLPKNALIEIEAIVSVNE